MYAHVTSFDMDHNEVAAGIAGKVFGNLVKCLDYFASSCFRRERGFLCRFFSFLPLFRSYKVYAYFNVHADGDAKWKGPWIDNEAVVTDQIPDQTSVEVLSKNIDYLYYYRRLPRTNCDMNLVYESFFHGRIQGEYNRCILNGTYTLFIQNCGQHVRSFLEFGFWDQSRYMQLNVLQREFNDYLL
jgi:hypothetical protein